MEQGPEKSGCFCNLLRWSVGRHWLLRSRWTHSRQRSRTRQSVFMLIALGADSTKSGNVVPEIPRQGFMELPLLPLRSYCSGHSLPMGWPVSPSGRLPSQLNTSQGSKTATPSGGDGVSSPAYLFVTIQIGGRVFSRCTCCALRSNRASSRELSMVI